MDHFYRWHIISAHGALNLETNQWTPEFVVSWKVGSETITREISLKIIFATKQEAEHHAFEFARKWIDNGKPTFSDA